MEKHPCFVALTRPVMRFGVTATFFGLNFFGHIMALFITKLFWIMPISFVFFHGVGMLVLSIDPRFIDLFKAKLTCCRAENYLFWGCNSYEPY